MTAERIEWQQHMTGHLPDSLDAAWAEVKALLPEGWHITELHQYVYRDATQRWMAMVNDGEEYGTFTAEWGDTEIAALRALAAKLREQP